MRFPIYLIFGTIAAFLHGSATALGPTAPARL
jgi:hypothetical protein